MFLNFIFVLSMESKKLVSTDRNLQNSNSNSSKSQSFGPLVFRNVTTRKLGFRTAETISLLAF